jgi:protein-S-isoprenylcysteine O-methyltransferase Ste14
MRRSADAPNLVVLPPVLFAVTLVAGLLCHWLRPYAPLPISVARISAVALTCTGAILAIAAERVMKRAGTNVLPTQPALALVTSGPFRFTRNPLYVAATCIYLGIALWFDALAPLLLAIPMLVVLHRGVVLREEQYLAAKFGDAYRAYCTRVRRWL